jgi:hypothetical protein
MLRFTPEEYEKLQARIAAGCKRKQDLPVQAEPQGKAAKSGDGAAAFESGEGAPPKFFDAAEVAKELGCWWQSGKDAFLMQDLEGRWLQSLEAKKPDEKKVEALLNLLNRNPKDACSEAQRLVGASASGK